MIELALEADELLQLDLIEEGFERVLLLVLIKSLELHLYLLDNSADHFFFE